MFPESCDVFRVARGNATRMLPEGRHSAPVPEKALRAPVAASENDQSRGK